MLLCSFQENSYFPLGMSQGIDIYLGLPAGVEGLGHQWSSLAPIESLWKSLSCFTSCFDGNPWIEAGFWIWMFQCLSSDQAAWLYVGLSHVYPRGCDGI